MIKKFYEKPGIEFSNFAMANGISGGCEYITNHAYMSCAYEDSSFTYPIFTDEISACGLVMPDGYDSICYHAPDSSNNLFTS